jgi:hypothetical protein
MQFERVHVSAAAVAVDGSHDGGSVEKEDAHI